MRNAVPAFAALCRNSASLVPAYRSQNRFPESPRDYDVSLFYPYNLFVIYPELHISFTVTFL